MQGKWLDGRRRGVWVSTHPRIPPQTMHHTGTPEQSKPTRLLNRVEESLDQLRAELQQPDLRRDEEPEVAAVLEVCTWLGHDWCGFGGVRRNPLYFVREIPPPQACMPVVMKFSLLAVCRVGPSKSSTPVAPTICFHGLSGVANSTNNLHKLPN